MYLINSSKKSFDHILFRKNLIWSGSLIVIIGILSSFNRILNFYFYYYLGLNKFGMKSFESIQGNTWRGLSSSAEAVGEYFIFIIIFIIFSLFKNALTECLFLIASETFIMKYYTKYFVGLNSF